MGKASVWLVANAAFGLAPLAFLWVINPLLKEHDAEQAIHELMRGGTVLFVCCALMGATVIDLLQSKIRFAKFSYFLVNVSPFIMLFIICLLYILIITDKIDENIFTSFSDFYMFAIAYTVFYCTLAKYFYFKKEIPNI